MQPKNAEIERYKVFTEVTTRKCRIDAETLWRTSIIERAYLQPEKRRVEMGKLIKVYLSKLTVLSPVYIVCQLNI
jgi:hypothetical protein